MAYLTYKRLGSNGRMGNQLWQIAATVNIARRRGDDAIFKRWDYRSFFSFPDSLFGHQFAYEVPHEDNWLNLNNLDRVGDDMRGWLNPSPHSAKVLRPFVDRYDPASAVGVHVRRGDYNRWGGVNLLPVSYYLNAWPSGRVLIFSDDHDWCRENLPEAEIVTGGNEIVDFHLLRQCSGHIIANSTFSWWAAYGSADVKYPSFWWAWKEIVDSERFLPHWTKVPVE